MFGSHAWGAAPRCSDLDLLVWQTSLPPLERIGRVPRTLGELPWGVEPVVLTPAELEEERRRLPFLRSVLKEARLVYEP
ncbi:MAG: nucleotidyltransferase domain-containing protein [Meiothermus sp.]|uniref:nucleotidyltransferase domain-containing protein n=1 Tax=Meiothermus sp. TaxID=1955249 RepID=UPI00298F2B4C|nr:nucleotidyltransferase domain-containing protein [Meiothermus sp.]MDW8482504.1 nucleotidyltransferase domain-containing protein [Meiothermus sp.]